MNYLAHAFLSFNHPEILVGNMISDYVKGKKKYNYPPLILAGINLHRQIDAFTDCHPSTKEAAVYFKPAVGTYAGAFVDVMYDHFLANDAQQFTNDTLQQHALNTYDILSRFQLQLPLPFRLMLPYMISQNWLYNYHTLMGVQKSFGGVVRRATYLQSSDEVFELFQLHYASLQKCYNSFFPDVKTFAFNQLQIILDT